MALQYVLLDLPVSESKDLGEGRVIYSFNKDQHARLLLRNLANMQATEGGMLTDVVVSTKSNDVKEPFHSMLLAACSPVFKQSLTGKHFDCTAGAISLGDMTPHQLEAFRDFFYKSEIPFDEGIVYGLQRVASRYHIDSLSQLCGQRSRDQRMSVWSKHHEDMLSQLHDMFQKSELATTFLEDKEVSTQFTVHGPIIAAASPVLKDILSNDLFAQEGSKYRLKEVTSNTLGDLIEYIYTGEVTLEGENVVDLLNAACCYEIPSLASACCDWLTLQMNAYNAIGIWGVTRKTDCDYTSELQKEAKKFIVANFISVCQEDEFLELKCEDLKEIIQDDSLCVEGEEDVFSAVATWVEADEEGRSSYFCDLLQCVRLEYTSLEFLREVEEDPLVKNSVGCLQVVHDAHAKLATQEPTGRRACDGVEASDIQRDSIPRVEPWQGDDEDVKRMLLQEFLDSQPQMPTLKSAHDSDDGLKEVTKQTPRMGIRKKGKPDLRLRDNRQRLGLSNKDGSPDMRFKVNKDTFRRSPQENAAKAKSQKGVVASSKEGPLKRDGTPDMRFKVNKEAFRPSSSQKIASQVESVPLKRDGMPDMRFRVNKTAAAKSPSSPGASGPVKRDGTLDMRFAVNKPSRRPAPPQTSSSVAQSLAYAGPLKSDGTPDMRYAANKYSVPTSHSSSPRAGSVSQMPSSRTPGGPLKRDGTPDMRYAVNKSPHSSPMSSGYSSSGSMSSLSGSISGSCSYGPLKSDGTPDMRFSANKSAYGSSSSSGSSSSLSSYSSSTYSSSSSSSGRSYGPSASYGPLKSDGTPDMRYAANKSAYGSSSSCGSSSYSSRPSSSGSSYGGSRSCGPLKSDGTPDMRYAANRRK